MDILIKAFDLSNKIIKREYLKDNWQSILDDIAKLFEVDGAFIGFWENGIIHFKHSSFFISSNFPKDKYPKLYSVPLKERKQFHERLTKEGVIEITDYQSYEFALKPWKQIGLKSILAVAIRTNKNTYGSLHLVSIKRKRIFDKEIIEILKKIANTIASEIEKEKYVKEVEQEREKNKKQLEFLSLLDNQLKDEISAEIISKALKKIKNMIGSDASSLLFPSENLYIYINDKSVIGTIKDCKHLPIYKLWLYGSFEISEMCLPASDLPYAIFVPIILRGNLVAIFCFSFKKEPEKEKKREVKELKAALTHLISVIHTYRNIKTVSSKLSETEEGLIEAFVSATEAKDVYTKGHSEHVAIYSKVIAKKIGLDIEQQEMVYNAGLLHDIGKIGIPDAILLKPSSLTPFEFEIMKYHPIISYEIIKNVPKFKETALYIRHHHEKIDGSGYPDGLKGDQIELGARILAIADIFDALTTNRPYREGLEPEEAIKVLREEKIDKEILKKVENELIKSFLDESHISTSYIPPQIEKIRKDILDFDFMTGLKKRSYLIKELDKLIQNKSSFTLFMVDIKNTSFINYKYGRNVGDKIIMFVANTLKKLPIQNSLSRIGSDSFMFVYLGKNTYSFINKIEKKLKKGIIDQIKASNCILNEEEAKKVIGCYVTFASFPEEGKSAEDLMYICSLKKKKKAYKEYAKISYKENC